MVDFKEVAETSPYSLVTDIKDCPLDNFWVVLLDCDIEVYQSEDDPSLDEPSPWMRLKKFCKEQKCSIANMAYASKNLNPDCQINFNANADGYYYSRRVRKIMCSDPRFAGHEDYSEGFGELHGDTLNIVWKLDDGRMQPEIRNLKENPKAGHLSLIRK